MRIKPNPEKANIHRSAIAYFGTDHQLRQAQEECAELITAVSHYLRDDHEGGLEGVIEECADVEIVCRSIRLIVGSARVDEAKARKLARLAERIGVET